MLVSYCVVVWAYCVVLCCGVAILLWCGYCLLPFESFVLRHLVIATSVTPRNYPKKRTFMKTKKTKTKS